MIFFLFEGATSDSSSYDEYMYEVLVENSAAQVSTRLNTGSTPSLLRNFLISLSVVPTSLAILISEKPLRLMARMKSSSRPEIPSSTIFSSYLMSSSI